MIDDFPSGEEARYSQVMPFVTTKDNGGVHDDDSYVCGFEMGMLNSVLAVMLPLGVLRHVTQIHTANREQADLLAMRYGLSATFKEYSEVPEWTEAVFTISGIGDTA